MRGPVQVADLGRAQRRDLRRGRQYRLHEVAVATVDGALVVGPRTAGPPPWHIRLDAGAAAALRDALDAWLGHHLDG